MIKRTKKMRSSKFIDIVADLLQTEQYKDVIRWDKEGKRILIVDKLELTNTVLPQYFKHANYSSFLRQLNMYGFISSKDIQGYLTYMHPHFTKKEIKTKQIQKKEIISLKKNSSQSIISQHKEFEKTIKLLKTQQDNLLLKFHDSVIRQLQIKKCLRSLIQTKVDIQKQAHFFSKSFLRGTKRIVNGLQPEAQNWYKQLVLNIFLDDIEEPVTFTQQLSPIPFGKQECDIYGEYYSIYDYSNSLILMDTESEQINEV